MLRRTDGKWTELLNETKDWLNKYISPHNLISISLFEDVHEMFESQGINVCITHTEGKNPNLISSSNDSLYSLKLIVATKPWKVMFG